MSTARRPSAATRIDHHWFVAAAPYWMIACSAAVDVLTHASVDRAAAPIGYPASLLSSTNSIWLDANDAAVSVSLVIAPATPSVGVFA